MGSGEFIAVDFMVQERSATFVALEFTSYLSTQAARATTTRAARRIHYCRGFMSRIQAAIQDAT